MFVSNSSEMTTEQIKLGSLQLTPVSKQLGKKQPTSGYKLFHNFVLNEWEVHSYAIFPILLDWLSFVILYFFLCVCVCVCD
jgi:hypothetical protein